MRDEQNCPILVWMECCIALTTLAGSLLANLQHRPHRLPQVDARAVTRELLLRYFGCVLALSEAIVLVVGGRRLLLRVTATNSLDAEAQEERVAYHCFRGGQMCTVLYCFSGCGSTGGAGGVPLLQGARDFKLLRL